MEMPSDSPEEKRSMTDNVPLVDDDGGNEDGKYDCPVVKDPSEEQISEISKGQKENPRERRTLKIGNLETKNDDESTKIDDASDKLERNISFSFDWSQAFKSPDILGFSPSQISHHGLGLQMAVERNKSTALFLGNISIFLSGVANIYEQLGINLINTSKSISLQQLSFKTSIDDDFQSLYESILSLGTGLRNSADCYRNTIISSQQKTLTENRKITDAAIKRYREVKQASLEARKLALTNYSNSTNAVKAAEMEIQSWASNLQQKKNNGIVHQNKEQVEIETIDEDLAWEKPLRLLGEKENEIESTNRLIQKLKVVLSYETQYIESVFKGNESVKVVVEAEVLALSKTQKMEQDLLNFFVSVILGNVFPNNNNNERVSVMAPANIQNSGDTDKPFTDGIEKKGIDLLANLFKQQSIPYIDGSGKMDAETLGLPESVGIKRDNVKSLFSTRENRIKVTEIVVKLFEEITNVTSKSSSRLRSQIVHQMGRSSEDNSPAGNLWLVALNIFEDEAKLISGSTFKVSKLESWLSNSRKNLANEIDMDDSAWKHVCDAARTEMRFETRYKQTKQQMNKARQRASSKELSQRGSSDYSDDIPQSQRKRNDSSGSMGTPNRVGRAFFKGGEAMIKLAEKSIGQIQQIGMNEVDQKETKDQLALEEASVAKNRATLAYTTYTTERIDKIIAEDGAGWIELKETIEKLTECFRALNRVRYTVFEKRISEELDSSFQSLVVNIDDWSKNVRTTILKSDQKSSPTNDVVSEEYTFTKKVIKTDNIDQLLGMSETEQSIIPKLKVANETSKTRSEEQEIDCCKTTVEAGPETLNTNATTELIPQKLPTKTITPSTKTLISFDSGDENKSIYASIETNFAKEKEESPEMKAFVKQFWSKKPQNKKLPDILEIYTCAYRPKDKVAFLNPYFPGRLYTTTKGIYFLGPEKKFTLQWEMVISIKKERGFMGSNNDNDLVITYRSKSIDLSFVLCRLRSRDKTLIHLQNLKEESEKSHASKVENSSACTAKEVQLQPVPPDLLLKDMEIVVSKTIKNVSITSIFERVWADRPGNKSFYGSWLEEEECYDISTEEWKFDGDLRNKWCNEKYDQERLVTFKFNRTTHLYIGPPVAFVKQQQFCRVEGDDKVVVAISAEFEGIPYADSFAVEMRWVALRKGTNNVHVQVGLFVVFKKNTMLKSQIKAGTIAETKNVHVRLFDAVNKVCVGSKCDRPDKEDSEDEGEEGVEEEENEITKSEQKLLDRLRQNFTGSLDLSPSSVCMVAILFAGGFLIRAIFETDGQSDTQRLENRIQELHSEVRALHISIESISDLLKEMRSERE